jgi:hypothetical protein
VQLKNANIIRCDDFIALADVVSRTTPAAWRVAKKGGEMNNLVINPDQQTGSFNGRKIVASRGGGCDECALIQEDACGPEVKCFSWQRKDHTGIIWQYAPDDPGDTAMLDYATPPPDTLALERLRGAVKAVIPWIHPAVIVPTGYQLLTPQAQALIEALKKEAGL